MFDFSTIKIWGIIHKWITLQIEKQTNKNTYPKITK